MPDEAIVNKTVPQITPPLLPEVPILIENNEPAIDPRLQKVQFSPVKLAEMKQDITTMINVMDHPSSISRAAVFWGKLLLWQKVMGAMLMFAAVFALLIIPYFTFLLAASICASIIYILNDHYNQDLNRNKDLTKGVLAMVDTLGSLIESIQEVSLQLSSQLTQVKAEVERFGGENKNLKGTVTELTSIKEGISTELDALQLYVNTLTTFRSELKAMSVDGKKLAKIQEKFADFVNDKVTLKDFLGDFTSAAKEAKEAQLKLNESNAQYQKLNEKYDNLYEKYEKLNDRSERLSERSEAQINNLGAHVERLARHPSFQMSGSPAEILQKFGINAGNPSANTPTPTDEAAATPQTGH